MAHFVDVCAAGAPDLSALLSACHSAWGEPLARAQDKAPHLSAYERFASLATSLAHGQSTLDVDPQSWDHLAVTVVVVADSAVLLAVIDQLRGAVVTTAPPEPRQPLIALASHRCGLWRDAVKTGVADARPDVAAVFADLYRSFCRRGYASLWNECRATTRDGRLLLESK